MSKEYIELVKDLKKFLLEEKQRGKVTIFKSLEKEGKESRSCFGHSLSLKQQEGGESSPGYIGDGPTRTLEELQKKYADCQRCSLGKTRIKFVFGEGNPHARLMFIGEGPGFDEDQTGRPFIGRAGQLLTKAIETTIGLKREECYIANIVKCHPMVDPTNPLKRGNDRPPTAEEAATCISILYQQIEIIQPRLICFLGNSAAQTMLKTTERISHLRGKFQTLLVATRNIPCIATLHPASCLYHQDNKRFVWEDFKKIREFLKEI